MPQQEKELIDMKCKVCDKESCERGFCHLHLKTYAKVVLVYVDWKKGLRISWEDYLRRIRDNSFTGKWAREVAEYLINKEEKGNVEKS